jgi:hypothetical protein
MSPLDPASYGETWAADYDQLYADWDDLAAVTDT